MPAALEDFCNPDLVPTKNLGYSSTLPTRDRYQRSQRRAELRACSSGTILQTGQHATDYDSEKVFLYSNFSFVLISLCNTDSNRS